MNTLVTLALATLLSEDAACLAAAALIARREVDPIAATAACAFGIYAGDIGLYLVGRLFGPRLLRWRRVAILLPDAGTTRFASWFDRQARTIVLLSRFTPGSRLPLYLAAGACGASFPRFLWWSAIAVGTWTPLLVGGAAAVGQYPRLRTLVFGSPIHILIAVVACCIVLRVALRLLTQRGRQAAAARISRIWRWEFWPMWLFYAPVAVWTMVLALRHGGYRSLTAANPGIADGGVVGESKLEILSRLPVDATIPAAAIEPDGISQRMLVFDEHVRTRRWTFPLILKPDVGQRGAGVRLVATAAMAQDYLAQVPARVIVQPYHPGPYEAGIFYYRRAGERRGRILAITDKHFPAVIGDGRSSLETLVWAHPRLRMQARTFLSRLKDRSQAVPAPGERVALAIAGNHAQGTMFTDGRWMITPALEARVDEIARQYDGFHIGRFDVRYMDRAEFMAGRDLAIVELNGATAECTNIYDPAGSLLAAYRQLFLQWKLVFEIGAENRRRGTRASSGRRLYALLRGHLTSETPLPVSD